MKSLKLALVLMICSFALTACLEDKDDTAQSTDQTSAVTDTGTTTTESTATPESDATVAPSSAPVGGTTTVAPNQETTE